MPATLPEDALVAFETHFQNPEHRVFAELRLSILVKDLGVYTQWIFMESILKNIKKLNKQDSMIQYKHAIFLLGDLLQKGGADGMPTVVSFEDKHSTYKDNWTMLLKLSGAESLDMRVPDWSSFCDRDKATTLARKFLPDSLCPPLFAPIGVAEVMSPDHFGQFNVYCSVMKKAHGSDIDAIDRRMLLLAFFYNGFHSKNVAISAAFQSWKYSKEGLEFFALMQFRLAEAVNETEKTIINLALQARFSTSSPNWPSNICDDEYQSIQEHGNLVLILKKK